MLALFPRWKKNKISGYLKKARKKPGFFYNLNRGKVKKGTLPFHEFDYFCMKQIT